MSWKRTADVVVIGAGVQGCSIAYNLAKMGVKDIVVLEKGTICSGSTGRCGAGIRAQWGTEMNCRFGLAAVEKFEQLHEELGMDCGLNQSGYLMVAYKDSEFEQLQKSMKLQNSLGINTRVVTYDEAKEICPGLAAEDAVGFTFHDRDGHADPFLTTFAYMEAGKRLGVKFLRFTEATDVKTVAGRVAGIVSSRGDIDAPVVVNAAGGYSQFISKMAGVEIPNFSERHEILITEPVEPGVCPPMLMSFSGNYYIQQRPHGSIIGGCSPEGHPQDYELGNSWDFLEMMSRTFVRLLPRTKGVRVVRQWSGLYNMTPDRQPVLCEADNVKGFFLSCGYSGHGFMFGPISGELLAQLILGQEPWIPIGMLHYSRFERGELLIEPAVV
ncbi:MAG TPA: FAD-binding oxidoreductase [Synergistales bacterium]|jgi:sarcosine oxidase subunit beta|nr:FAD-binding oxidoreductase [Synergistales bacterium]MDD4023833.1 FAD-binding oxidoreductase [Synergistales bacterium]MDD5513909.1 FAD-binding oxidoreductase [Synergistales bacterium]HOI81122.1 FAD-binding oxidoreductase [Synergistales bacterium]HOP52136.1 FAD-binding oxidoreductase [Synergistales bacterium]